MTGTVITLIAESEGALDEATVARAAEAARSLGAGSLDVRPLHPGKAADIALPAYTPALATALREKFAGFGRFDVFVQPDDAHRKKRLLVADMDATIIEGETLDELAAHFNLKDKIAPITARAMNGEIDFAEALRMRVGLLKGLPVSALNETLKAVRFSRGAATLVKTMNRSGAKCVLISGGFDIFTGYVAASLGFYKNFGNRLGIAEEKLTGDVIPPIVDKFVKKKTVEEEAKRLNIDLRAVAAVGDGANDIPMLQAAGTGVGYFGKPAVQAATPYQIRYTDLTSILYLQGFRREEFAA